MPELLEVEAYRELLARQGVGRTIARVRAPDDWYLKEGLDARTLRDVATGASFSEARRHGKLLLGELAGGPVLGLRFGMTGRLLVDGRAAVDRLVYSTERTDRAYDRVILEFEDGGDLRMHDPRRLGGVILEPDVDRLGPDATGLTESDLRRALDGRTAPIKAILMDQSVIAGLGNLLADDILWRASIDPARPAGSLDRNERRRLHRNIGRTLRVLGRRGGSHTGDLQQHRREPGACPRCGAPLRRRRIGGRTTVFCPHHQG